ncbi:MAG: hypothetical protein NTY48_02955 [Candidatus Diapherotrites archaeon]|nr:hypothetical protein [Candidatus Diapherotrites archaeon]
MYLGNPLLPINITALGAADAIKKELLKKSWHEYELKPLKLNLMPYFLFNYHYFLEDSADEQKTVKSTVHGILAVDGHRVEVRPDLVELLKENWKKNTQEAPRGVYNEKWCNIEKREQDDILKIKTAKHFNIPKNNVFVSSPKKMLIPLYYTFAVLGEKEYKFVVNAIDGRIEGLDTVPNREKSYAEITRETINELKNPANWIKYSKEAIFSGKDAAVSKAKSIPKSTIKISSKKFLNYFDSREVLIVIMVLAVILIIIGFFKI